MRTEPTARATDPITSHMAAEGAKAFAGTHKERILGALGQADVMTAQRIAETTGLTVVQVDRRLTELEREKLIEVVTVAGQTIIMAGYRVWRRV